MKVTNEELRRRIRKILAESKSGLSLPEKFFNVLPKGLGNKQLSTATTTSPGVYYVGNTDEANAMMFLLKGEGTSFGQQLEEVGVNILEEKFPNAVGNLNLAGPGVLGGLNFEWADLYIEDNDDLSSPLAYKFGNIMISAKATLIENKDPLNGNQPKGTNCGQMGKRIISYLSSEGVNTAGFNSLHLRCAILAFRPMFFDDMTSPKYSSILKNTLQTEFKDSGMSPEEILANTTPILMELSIPKNHNVVISDQRLHAEPTEHEIIKNKGSYYANQNQSLFANTLNNTTIVNLVNQLVTDHDNRVSSNANIQFKNKDISNLGLTSSTDLGDRPGFLFKTIFTDKPPKSISDFSGGMPSSGTTRKKANIAGYIDELTKYGNFTKNSSDATVYDINFEFTDLGFDLFLNRYITVSAEQRRKASYNPADVKNLQQIVINLIQPTGQQSGVLLGQADRDSVATALGQFAIGAQYKSSPTSFTPFSPSLRYKAQTKQILNDTITAIVRGMLGKLFRDVYTKITALNPATFQIADSNQNLSNISKLSVKSAITGEKIGSPNSVNRYRENYGGTYDIYTTIILLGMVSEDSPEMKRTNTMRSDEDAASDDMLSPKTLSEKIAQIESEFTRLSSLRRSLELVIKLAPPAFKSKIQELLVELERDFERPLKQYIKTSTFNNLLETAINTETGNATDILRATGAVAQSLSVLKVALEENNERIIKSVVSRTEEIQQTGGTTYPSHKFMTENQDITPSYESLIQNANQSAVSIINELISINAYLSQLLSVLTAAVGQSAPSAQLTPAIASQQLQVQPQQVQTESRIYENILKKILYTAKKRQ